MGVYVERVGHRIHLDGWVPDCPQKAKRVVGYSAQWDRSVEPNKFIRWTFPLDYTTCLQLREQFGADLEIGPELSSWARAEKKKRAELSAVLASSAFDIPAVEALAPKLARAMADRTYQQVGSAFLSRSRRALLADQPGLGKSLQAMGAVLEAGITGPILVLAPTTAVTGTWPPELQQWLPDDRVFVAAGSRSRRQKVLDEFSKAVANHPDERIWLICNFEMVRAVRKPNSTSQRYWGVGPYHWTHENKSKGVKEHGNWWHPYPDLFIDWAAIFADESQRALITRTPVKEEQSQTRCGLGMLRIREDGMRHALSGTPFRGKLENMWGTLNWLRPDMYRSYWNWAKRYFNVYSDGFGLTVEDINPDLEAEFYRELDSIMLRRTKQEVVKELPPKMYAGWTISDAPDALHGIWLEMTPQQEKAYRQMELHAEAELESGSLLATGVLAEMTRLKQFASCYGDIKPIVRRKVDKESGVAWFEDAYTYDPQLPSNKFDWLLAWLIERGIAPEDVKHPDYFGDNKVIIASQFTQMIDLFSAELGARGAHGYKLTGATPAAKRRKVKEAFQSEGGPRIFMLNTTAGGVSLTLDAADDVIFLDEMWIPDDDEQVEDRAHRVSRMHQVTIWKLRSIGTIDETIGATSSGRDSIQKQLLDGRRGVAYARQLIKGKK